MDKRYRQTEITRRWSLAHKLGLWQKIELAVILAREQLEIIPKGTHKEIANRLKGHPIDIPWFEAKDAQINHDMNAAIAERRRWLKELAKYYHEGVTSYDIEDIAFVMMLKETLVVVDKHIDNYESVLVKRALLYRHTAKLLFTHGQYAELGTEGSEMLAWIQALRSARKTLDDAKESLIYGKCAGATSQYATITPLEEKTVLAILGLVPYVGATQIMPRVLYTPIAFGLYQIVQTLNKNAIDVRLSARSGMPTRREGFGAKQMGSSVMPHKRNPVRLEQIQGMEQMAEGYLCMLLHPNITWEYRSIEMSSLERVAWSDLLHVVVHSLKSMTRIMSRLETYPDTMFDHIIQSADTWAASRANVFLLELFGDFGQWGLEPENIYRIVQLAAFNSDEPSELALQMRESPSKSRAETQALYLKYRSQPKGVPVSIKDIIASGSLKPSSKLDISADNIKEYNAKLSLAFARLGVSAGWERVFSLDDALIEQNAIFEGVLGELALAEA